MASSFLTLNGARSAQNCTGKPPAMLRAKDASCDESHT